MRTSTTVTDNSGNIELMDSLQRNNTDTLPSSLNTYDISPSKNQSRIKLKSRPSFKEDSKEYFQGWKGSGVRNTDDPKRTLKDSSGVKESNPEIIPSSNGCLSTHSISNSSAYLRGKPQMG